MLLMCQPDYYDIQYEINAWMDTNNKAIQNLAIEQWQHLYQTIKELGSDISLIKPVKGLPDMVSTANAGLIFNHQVLLSNFANTERQSESMHYKQWFIDNHFKVHELENASLSFEGAGDALFIGKTLIGGYGMRSHREAYQDLFFNHLEVIACELVNPYFYHLDTCFCPVNDNLAIWYPNAFSIESQKKLQNVCELIPLSDIEAYRFGCNAIVLDKHIILPTGCDQLSSQLNQKGFSVINCEMSEFLKAGGACKCLTLLTS